MKLTLLTVLLLSFSAASAQTTIGLWRMGENDPGAVANTTVAATLTAATGTNLTLAGSTLHYRNMTPGAASSLAVEFGGSGNYATGSNFGLTGDFAVEAWVKLGDVSTAQWVTLLGNGGNNGIGLFVSGGFIGFGLAGTGMVASTTATTSSYVHVALVSQGTDVTFYHNGTQVGTASSLPTLGANFSVGGDENGAGRLQANGLVDHVRMFTFSNGTFNSSMFSYPASAIPEPSTYAALAGVAALGLAVWCRRRAAA